MKLFYQNCRGLRTKATQCRKANLINSFDIYLLTETWLTDAHFSHEFFDQSFDVIRRDRSDSVNSRGGGVCIAIKKSNSFKYLHQLSWQSINIEDAWVSIYPHKGRTLHICCCYIPGSTSPEIFASYITSLTDRVLSLNQDDVIFIGDQNVPEFYNQNLARGTKFHSLMDMMDFCDFSQFNTIINSLSSTVLDLVFSNSQLTELSL